MIFLFRHLERISVFTLLVIIEGVFWTPRTFFAGPGTNQFARDPYSTTYFILLIAFLAIVFTLRAGSVIPRLFLAWPILPLVCFAYSSAVWSGYPGAVFTQTTKVTAAALLGVYLASRGDYADLIAILVKANLVAVAASFLIYFVAPKYAFSTTAQYAHAWRGAFTDKNGLGINAGFGIIFGIYAFTQRYGSRIFSGIAIPSNIFLLIQSQSKTPIVMMLAVIYIVALGVALRHRTGPGAVLSFVLIVIGLIGAMVVAIFYADLLSGLGRDPTLTERTRIWKTVTPYFERRPWLGYGFGSFWIPQSLEANQVWQMLSWKAPTAHNLWVQLALDLGLTGCLLAAFAWLMAFGRAARLLLSPTRTEVVFPLAVLVGILIENFTEYEFFIPSLLWVLYCAFLVHLGRALLIVGAARPAATFIRPLVAPAPLLGINANRQA